ncbi:MAG: hypothetical protein EP347_00190 [Alphaproteobacteria bacterium]|nr:MAG: hypothetical protein EP347_00190 [Alphaproteobacteria bacterium]
MERPNTVAGLVAKREQLRADLKAAEKAIRNIRVDIDHLDAAIRLFTEDAPRRLPEHSVAHRASRGEMQRFVLGSLKDAQSPLTSFDITQSYVKSRGLKANEATLVMMRKRVGACLNTLKHNGTVEDVPLRGQYKGWRLRGGDYVSNGKETA